MEAEERERTVAPPRLGQQPRAVGTNQKLPRPADPLSIILCCYRNPILILFAAFYGMPEQELEVRIVFQEDEQNPREVPLLAL